MLLAIVTCAAAATAVALAADVLVRAWDRLALGRTEGLRDRLRALGADDSWVNPALRVGAGVATAGAFALWYVLGVPALAAVALLLTRAAPRVLLAALVRRRERQLRDGMVPACTALANAARAGFPLAGGLELAAAGAREPLAGQLLAMCRACRAGRRLEDVLAETRERLRLDVFTLFATTLVVCQEKGGRVTDALDRLAQGVQEHQRLEWKLAAETAAARRVLLLLAVFPVAFLAVSGLLYADGARLVLHSGPGQLVLLAVCGLVWAAVALGGRLTGRGA